MGNKKRLKRHVHRAMFRRLKGCKVSKKGLVKKEESANKEKPVKKE
jgi:hypothetical protein